MMFVRHEDRDGIAVIELDDIARRNVLSCALVEQLAAAVASSLSTGARALVIGARGRVFCGGADIADLLNSGWMEGRSHGPDPMDVFEAIEKSPRPVIAAVDGPAFGGGCEMTLCCDLVIASEQASFAMPEVGHGVIPNTGLAKLSGLVGRRMALELAMTGRSVPAREARELGLVNMVVPTGTAVDAAVALARQITDSAPPGALAAVKVGFARHQPTDWNATRDSLALTDPPEWREGLGAFLQKRRPDYARFWRERDET